MLLWNSSGMGGVTVLIAVWGRDDRGFTGLAPSQSPPVYLQRGVLVQIPIDNPEQNEQYGQPGPVLGW